MIWYNEIDPFCAQWLRNLIAAGHLPDGDVDETDIRLVDPGLLRRYEQCHFFAGIGGWPLALRLAGWPDGRSAWTGSCPCQPFSSAARGRQSRLEDRRHLWPVWRELISECAPRIVFGEQTPQAGDWFDEVCDDMEALGYSVGAAILPACSIGLNHARHRLYFCCHTNRYWESGGPEYAEAPWLPRDRCLSAGMAGTDELSVGVAQLRAYGNAIVPALGAEFIKAVMECIP